MGDVYKGAHSCLFCILCAGHCDTYLFIYLKLTIPVLQVRKSRRREIKQFAKVTKVESGCEAQTALLSEPELCYDARNYGRHKSV